MNEEINRKQEGEEVRNARKLSCFENTIMRIKR